MTVPLTLWIIGEMYWWNSLNSRSWENIGKRKQTWIAECGKEATSKRGAEAYAQHRPKAWPPVLLSGVTPTHPSPHCYQTSVCIWNANTTLRPQAKSRSKLLISIRSHWKSCGRERTDVKNWIRSSWWYWSYTPFLLFFFCVKDNFNILAFFLFISKFFAHFC